MLNTLPAPEETGILVVIIQCDLKEKESDLKIRHTLPHGCHTARERYTATGGPSNGPSNMKLGRCRDATGPRANRQHAPGSSIEAEHPDIQTKSGKRGLL